MALPCSAMSLHKLHAKAAPTPGCRGRQLEQRAQQQPPRGQLQRQRACSPSAPAAAGASHASRASELAATLQQAPTCTEAAPPAAPSTSSCCHVRPADVSDYWAVADLHCCAFYPKASFFWFAALRVDRVMALQLGKERQADGTGRFACLVADSRECSAGDASMQASSSSSSDEDGSSGSDRSSSSSFGSSAAVAAGPAALSAAAGGRSYRLPPGLPAAVAATQEAAAAEGRVELGPLVDWFVNLFWPKYMCVNYASSYAGGGLLGAVVIDTMGEFVPPRRKEMPNGTVRQVPRPGICYLSNLAVAPCSRRGGVGRKLLREAEALAASWGCRSMALHVDPSNTAAVQMYRRAGYRKVMNQPEWQRILEQREQPLALYMRALPWEARQAAKRVRQAAEAEAALGPTA